MNETQNTDPDSSQESGPVLVAVDFSEDSQAALVWAAEHARIAGLALLVLHVVHDPAENPGFYQRTENESLRPMTEVADEMMNEFLNKIRIAEPDLIALQRATTRLVSGLPAGRIVEVAERVKAPLVVIGSRGLTGLPHVLLGSVAERVVQLATMPVVIIKHSPDCPD